MISIINPNRLSYKKYITNNKYKLTKGLTCRVVPFDNVYLNTRLFHKQLKLKI